MANEITKLDSAMLICDQTGDCGELIDSGGEGVTFVSQTTGGIVEFSGEDITVVDVSIDNLDQFIKEPVGINKKAIQISPEMFKGHMKPAEPPKDTPIQHTMEFNGESIRLALTPKEKKMFKENLLKAIEIYMKTSAKPAEAERLSEGLEKLLEDFHEKQKGEERHFGEMFIMERHPAFTPDELQSYLTSPPKLKITPLLIEELRQLLDAAKKKE